MTISTTTPQPAGIVARGATETPNLMHWFNMQTRTERPEWAPMTEGRRTELIDALVAWAKDPDALDWEYVNSHD